MAAARTGRVAAHDHSYDLRLRRLDRRLRHERVRGAPHYLDAAPRTPMRDPGYFIALGLGAIAGALLFGSFNMTLAGMWQIGHSIAGAVAAGSWRWRSSMARRHPRLDRRAIRGAAGDRHRRRAPGLLLRRTAGLHLWHGDHAAVGGGFRRRRSPPSGAALRIGRDDPVLSSSICAAIAHGIADFSAGRAFIFSSAGTRCSGSHGSFSSPIRR